MVPRVHQFADLKRMTFKVCQFGLTSQRVCTLFYALFILLVMETSKEVQK